jgi:mRNA-degrading endonuclease RelE of RelBE toxin-antitoxin system
VALSETVRHSRQGWKWKYPRRGRKENPAVLCQTNTSFLTYVRKYLTKSKKNCIAFSMEVRISTHATRQLRKLPASVRDVINNAVSALENWPVVANVKALQGREGYRLRVGRYRVLFEVTKSAIWVTEILIRDNNTYA